MLKAVLFDLGGTLIHYESPQADIIELNKQGFAALYNYLSANGQIALPETTFLTALNSRASAAWQAAKSSLRGGSIETTLQATLADLGLPFADEEWQGARRAFYAPIQQAANPRHGARQTLEILREKGLMLGILSNTFWSPEIHDEDLARFDLLDLLPIRLYSSDTGRLKPHRAAFEMALNALEVDANQAIYVGDRLITDVEPARQIGLWGVLIQVPFRDEASEELTPDAVISELPELVTLLEHRR